jgi:hypothetical protein
LCPYRGLLLESWDQQTGSPFLHLLHADEVCRHRQPDILPIALDLVSQPDSHRRRALGAPLAQALVWPHKVGEAHQEPNRPAVACGAPGQTPGAAPQGGDQPPPRPIPAFHARRLERRAALPEPPRLAPAAWTADDHAPAALHTMARLGAALDDLGVAQVRGGDEPGSRLAPHLPPPPATIDDAHHGEPRRALRFPAIGAKAGHLSNAGNAWSDQRGGVLRRAGADVDPEQQPTP